MNTGTFVIFIERETPLASPIPTPLGKNGFSSKPFIFLLFYFGGGGGLLVRVQDLDETVSYGASAGYNNLTVGPSPRIRYGIVAVEYILMDCYSTFFIFPEVFRVGK